jgi:SAM-dependent methyltransferase
LAPPNRVHVHVQGQKLDLLYDEQIRPTLFSLFLANVMAPGRETAFACDIGTGGGTLAIALALLGVERVLAVDCSEVACAMAEENVRRNGVGDRVEVAQVDAAELEIDGACDLVVSNPPTMPAVSGVPRFARGGSPGGQSVLGCIVDALPGWLSVSGRAEIALSSLDEPSRALEALAGDFSITPVASTVAPFRSFYANAYSTPACEEFVRREQALPGDGPAAPNLSELITVYRLERLDLAGREPALSAGG